MGNSEVFTLCALTSFLPVIHVHLCVRGSRVWVVGLEFFFKCTNKTWQNRRKGTKKRNSYITLFFIIMFIHRYNVNKQFFTQNVHLNPPFPYLLKTIWIRGCIWLCITQTKLIHWHIKSNRYSVGLNQNNMIRQHKKTHVFCENNNTVFLNFRRFLRLQKTEVQDMYRPKGRKHQSFA